MVLTEQLLMLRVRLPPAPARPNSRAHFAASDLPQGELDPLTRAAGVVAATFCAGAAGAAAAAKQAAAD